MTLGVAVTSQIGDGKQAKEKANKLDCIKIKHFCASKDALEKVKTTHRQEKVHADHRSDEELISRIYQQLSNKQPNLKMGKGLEQTFSEEGQ